MTMKLTLQHVPPAHPRPSLSRTAAIAAAALLVTAQLAGCGGSGTDSNGNPTVLAATATAQAAGTETALTPVGASASSIERGDLSAAAAIDHNAATRWSSGSSDAEYLTLDFGSTQTITRVHIDWENA